MAAGSVLTSPAAMAQPRPPQQSSGTRLAQPEASPHGAGRASRAMPQEDADVRDRHAHADRLIWAPSAETHPSGTFYLSVYELLVPQVGYAFSDRIQVSAAGLVDLGGSGAHVVDVAVKANLWRGRYLRLATFAAVDHLQGTENSLLIGRLGGAAQLCFDPGCTSAFVLASMLMAVNRTGYSPPLGVAAGLSLEITSAVSALLEYDGAWGWTSILPGSEPQGFYVGYGLRFGGTRWGLDITLQKPLEAAEQTGLSTADQVVELIGLPFVVFTYRWLLGADDAAATPR